MKKNTMSWIAPAFVVLAILVVWLTLYYLPSGTFGIEWSGFKDDMWIYLPFLVAFAVGLYVLKVIYERH